MTTQESQSNHVVPATDEIRTANDSAYKLSIDLGKQLGQIPYIPELVFTRIEQMQDELIKIYRLVGKQEWQFGHGVGVTGRNKQPLPDGSMPKDDYLY